MKDVLDKAIEYDPKTVVKFMEALYAALDVRGRMIYFELMQKYFNEIGDGN